MSTHIVVKQPKKKAVKKTLKRKQTKPGAAKLSLPPVSIGRVVNYNKPQLTSRGTSVEIKHSEYFADVSGHAQFTVEAFLAINPGSTTMCPWLSQVAGNYESYRFKDLSFRFEPVVGTLTNGSVMLAVDFDASDAAPQSKVRMMSYDMSTRGNAWETVILRNKKADLLKIKEKFITDITPGPNEDVKLFDVGNLIIATFGVTNGTLIGEMYVDYTVILDTPQLEPAAHFLEIDWTANTSPAAPFNVGNLLTLPVQGPSSTFRIGTAAGLASDKHMLIRKAGAYILDFLAVDSAGGAIQLVTPPVVTVVSGSATVTSIGTLGGALVCGNGSQGLYNVMLNVTLAPAQLTFDFSNMILNNISASISALRIYPASF